MRFRREHFILPYAGWGLATTIALVLLSSEPAATQAGEECGRFWKAIRYFSYEDLTAAEIFSSLTDDDDSCWHQCASEFNADADPSGLSGASEYLHSGCIRSAPAPSLTGLAPKRGPPAA